MGGGGRGCGQACGMSARGVEGVLKGSERPASANLGP